MLRILVILLALGLLALPFLPIRGPFTLYGYNFPEKKRPRNIIYIGSTLLVLAVIVALMPRLLDLADRFARLELVSRIIHSFTSHTQYGFRLFKVIVANLLFDALILALHVVCGSFGGLFAKDDSKSLLQRLRQYFRRLREKRRPQKENAAAAEDDALPEKLMPRPEKEDASGKVRISGGKETGKKKVPAKAPSSEREEENTDGVAWKAALDFVVGLFYEKRGDTWYVQPQSKKVAGHLRNFIVLIGGGYLVMFMLLMIPVFFPVENFARQFYDAMNTLVDKCYLYPSVSLVILTELFWFMNGLQADEEVKQVDAARSHRHGAVVDLDKVEKDLMQTFGADHEVKCFYADDVGSVESGRSPVSLSDDPVLQSVAVFVENQGLVRNDDYLRGVQALCAGRDTLFDAPLYTAAGMYLYPVLSMRISQGEAVVVVCQDADEIPAVIRNLENGFRRVLRTHQCLWQIAGRKDYRPENRTDVLVLTPEEFQDERLFNEAEDFFARVTLAVLPDADRVVMSNNYYCLVMAQRLRRYCAPGGVQYLFLATRHTLNLSASLTEYFMLSRGIHSVQAGYAYGSLRLYVWKARNDGREMLDNGSKSVRMEVGIAKVAQAAGVPSVNLVTESAIFPDQADPAWLDVYDASDRPIGFAVVADDGFNLPGTIYAYARYIGRQASVLHVVCRPYLLRDYFFDRAARSLYEQPLMERGMAEHARMQRSGLILLVCRLAQGMEVNTFASEVRRILDCSLPEKLDMDSLRELVELCLSHAFGAEAKKHSDFILYHRQDNRFGRSRCIRILEPGILESLTAETELVTLRFRNGMGRPDVKLNLFRRMLDQRYLEDQFLIYGHENYRIKKIDRSRGLIEIDDAEVVHAVPDGYVQVRHYTVRDAETLRKACRAVAALESTDDESHLTGSYQHFQGDIDGLLMVRSMDGVEIESDTVSYYPLFSNSRCLDLTDPKMVENLIGKAQREKLRRSVGQSLYLKLEGNFVRSDRLTMSFAVVLQEMMKTLFPDQYFCINVCPVLQDPDAVYSHSDAHSRRIAGIYPRLHGWGKPDERSMEVLIVDDCEGGTGVLDVLYSRGSNYLRNVLDMLSDFLQWQQGREASYLNFGAETTPALFDLEGLNRLMKVFSHKYVRERDLFERLQIVNCCALCGRPLSYGDSYLWDNRLNVCRECRDDDGCTRDEAVLILAWCAKYLTGKFGITLPDGLDVQYRPDMELSSLDVGQRCVYLAPELPLVNVHGEIASQLVRLWQIENLEMTGADVFEGQVRYVTLQYLAELRQYQRRRRVHRRSLLGDDGASVGYSTLVQALQTEGHENSFRYMLEHFRKGAVRPPVPQPKKMCSVRLEPREARRVFFEQLTENQRQAYEKILEGLMAMEKEIRFAELNLTKTETDRTMYAVIEDNPGIFWVHRRKYGFTEGSSDSHITGVIPVYCVDARERQRRQSELDEATAQFLDGITAETGEYEAALTIYERMAMELDYDSLALEAEKRRQKKADDLPDDLRSVYGALVRKRAVCAGYARAFSYLMQKLGIESMYVRGDCTGEGRHGWNIVRLEGEYYHVDVTWGDNSNTDPRKHGEGFGYNYFCVTDTDILKTRSVDPEPAMPPCTAVSCNYFVRSGLYFETYDHFAVCRRLAQLLADGKRRRVDMRFAGAPVMEAAKRQLAYNGGMVEILRAAGRDPQFSFSSDDTFHILSFFFAEGAVMEAPVEPVPIPGDPGDPGDPDIPGIDEPD